MSLASKRISKKQDHSNLTVSPLSTRAMLVSLNVQFWAAALTDKKVTSDVAKSHNVAEKWGKYRKNCIDVEAESYKALITAKSDLRNRYYELTLPWGQDGSRILTTTMFPKFAEEMRHKKSVVESAAKVFVEDFPALKRKAKIDLNDMYNENDYPTNVAAKFDVRWHFNPLPEGDDFRANLSADAVAEIREDIQQQLNKTAELAMKEPYQRLYDHISRMVERLSDEPVSGKGKNKEPKAKRFTDTLVTGLAELCSILPALNLTGDERLDELSRKAKKMIEGVSAEQLREVPTKRRDVAKEAKAIQDAMQVFMVTPENSEET